MITCKSQIRIYKEGEKEDFKCTVLTDKDHSLNELEENIVLLVADRKNSRIRKF